jgi:hypothetical protein
MMGVLAVEGGLRGGCSGPDVDTQVGMGRAGGVWVVADCTGAIPREICERGGRGRFCKVVLYLTLTYQGCFCRLRFEFMAVFQMYTVVASLVDGNRCLSASTEVPVFLFDGIT